MTKRLHPTANRPFTRGDEREDGKIFFRYTDRLKADGTFVEIWLAPDSLKKARKADSQTKMKGYERTTDRLPKGWKFACNDSYEMRQLRKWYKKAIEGQATEAAIKEIFFDNPKIVELLTPLCTDGN